MDKYEEQYTVPIAFLGKIVGGKPKPADDVEELEWFPLDDLPKNISFAGNKKALAILKGKFKLN
ncbi:hypothetical protein A2V95_02875 [Candidatus Kuenenbacteria bacterium RBG_16_41_7]|uniref:Nudix hydrolase domain-containing protein n=1 Tax=Candidatus Kuenenbacteria bacterium RBG_16_41_7 TaxID=1798560 RepID=A0A1F6GCD8_9BACT|nr:MAG: hypothetical protein A2V95_02875 [Candidatus Kuenenbacteria bacterium RBG_16_41_7]